MAGGVEVSDGIYQGLRFWCRAIGQNHRRQKLRDIVCIYFALLSEQHSGETFGEIAYPSLPPFVHPFDFHYCSASANDGAFFYVYPSFSNDEQW